MDIKMIRKALEDKIPGIVDIVHESAIIVPIIEVNNELHIIFEVRSHALNRQPGEICFPGGKIEENESPLTCAIRETCEELNISKEHIEIIGELDYLVTPFNMAIYPFCGLLKDIRMEHIHFNQDEVDSIFSVPIKELVSQEPRVADMVISTKPKDDFPFYLVQNGKAYDWKPGTYPVYFYQYKEHIIWGITAKILKYFLDSIRDENLT